MDNHSSRPGDLRRYVARAFVTAQLIQFSLDSPDADLPCWRLATIQITQADARAILRAPHFIESDPRATAGGTEDQWTYLAPDRLPAFFRLRVPYDTMDLCSTSPELPPASWDWVAALFGDYEIQRIDPPYNEVPSSKETT